MLPLTAAFFGAVLIAFAAPRFVAGALTAPFDEAVRALGRDETVSDKELRLALASRLRANALIGDGRYFAEAAALRFAEYQRDAASQERLATAIAAHRAAVARAPSQPFVWTRLAVALLSRDGYSPAVGDALRMSLVTGRYEPRLLLPRLELALQIWNRLPSDVRDELAGQIVVAMARHPDRLVDMARRTRRLAAVRAALSDRPELRGRFNLLYRGWR